MCPTVVAAGDAPAQARRGLWMNSLPVRNCLTMDLHFHGQPYPGRGSLLGSLTGALRDADLTDLRIVVAWAKRSGLRHLVPDMRAHRLAGGRIEAIVGISEGGATRQGLEILLQETDEAFVFFDRARTFHPKVFLAAGSGRSKIIVGSHNLTRGGLFWNYEASFVAELDHTLTADKTAHDDVLDYFTSLKSDGGSCVKLDSTSLAAMLADPRYRIGDEDQSRQSHGAPTQDPDDSDTDDLPGAQTLPQSAEGVFSISTLPKQPAPAAPTPATPSGAASTAAGGASTGPVVGTPASGTGGLTQPAPAGGATAPMSPTSTSLAPGAAGGAAVVRRWFKEMDRSAAQQPANPNTNPTGNLRLSAEGFNIDHTTYFRNQMFGSATWTSRPAKPTFEDATVSVDVVINGAPQGNQALRVSHSEDRISNQGNVATVLHWGPVLSAFLRSNNLVGSWLTLEALAGGGYRLTIGPAPTGSFVA